ncbi:MAG: hypothetical protein GY946_33055, partial [bacterium]|nr:hypothetical protein [bacterium]
MADSPRIRLPKQWSSQVRAGMLHAISLASVALVSARAQMAGRRRLAARLEQAENEIALLREELAIKDGRWQRSLTRRRPHYTAIQRMRILQLRAARGWSRDQTARIFLLDVLTLQRWTQRLDEPGERPFVQTVEPVNRYPDFVRGLVRQLKALFPSMGDRRLADVLARAGLHLAASTVRRMVREIDRTPEPEPEMLTRRRRRVVAKHAGHTWHVDLTTVPMRAGFSVPWFPFSLPQRWPFCWWVAVAVDQFSRAVVGVEIFR